MAYVIAKDRLASMRDELRLSHFVIGVDLGQQVDPTAITVLHYVREPLIEPDTVYLEVPYAPPEFRIRHLERLKLSMSYVDQAACVHQMMRTSPLTKAALIVDQTGVGRPCVDLFRRAGLRPIAVTITAGTDQTRERLSPSDWKVSKLMLVSKLQAAMHSGQLKIAQDLPETRALIEELADFQVSFSETGYARFGARVGKHDDLVLSAALAVWWAGEHRRATSRRRSLSEVIG